MIIHLYNLHGLIRGKELEIGRDSDNGGQIVYVWELAQALAEREEVTHIHLFTRRIEDPHVSSDYAKIIEKVSDKITIRRITCGGKKYLPKESLWKHLDEYVANAIKHIKEQKIHPDWMHSHYADAAYVVNELSNYLNVPFCHTAHSLGATKKMRLLEGGMDEEEADQKFSFPLRLQAEEVVLGNAEFVITSTQKEIKEFELYKNAQYSAYHVVPPGINFERFAPYFQREMDMDKIPMEEIQASHKVRQNIDKFFNHPDKPFILAICRPDKKKNIDGLLHAYGTNNELQAMANLVIFAGIREDINTMPLGEKEVLTDLLLQMDKYNLYGKLAIPKKHNTELDVPEAYRYCASKKGVFINPALTEHFGLTILEAAGCALPVVATKNGGPSEILPKCHNGVLIDPYKTESIQKGLRTLLSDPEKWQECSYEGSRLVRQHYSWNAHAENFIQLLKSNLKAHGTFGSKAVNKQSQLFQRLNKANKMFITDIDGTLVHDNGSNEQLENLKEILANRGNDFVFGVATGRKLTQVEEIFAEHNIPLPDVIISSVGTYVYYNTGETSMDKGWEAHVGWRWNRERIEKQLLSLPELVLQEKSFQNAYKVSFYVDSDDFQIERVLKALGKNYHKVNIIYSKGKFLDILPKRASKGRAIRYLSHKWAIPQLQTLVAGDTGNDYDMFTGPCRGIVVGNHDPELSNLKGSKKVYFAKGEAGAGIIEGMKHFKWIQ